jgi:hypothetical protein
VHIGTFGAGLYTVPRLMVAITDLTSVESSTVETPRARATRAVVVRSRPGRRVVFYRMIYGMTFLRYHATRDECRTTRK